MTDAARCPVCDEPLADRPDACFRCETPLQAWWPLDSAMRAAAGRRRGAALWLALPALAGGVALGGLLQRPPAPDASPEAPRPAPVAAPAPPLPAPPAAGPVRLRYHVQPGDSLWRVAAAVTGDGRRWRSLWPGHSGRLRPGEVLTVEAEAGAPTIAP